MVKKMFTFLGVIIWGIILVLAYINRFTTVQFNYLKGFVDCSLLLLIIFVAALAIFATYMLLQGVLADLEEKLKKQSRKSEKASISKEESDDKIKLLEAKIQTLEKALSDALKKD